jgi:periplasmic divalent cation tolerance protein
VKPIVIITTTGTEDQANHLAEELVERRHAACVNILPIHRSVYRWQGQVCEDSEFLLIIKSTDSEWEGVQETVRELHEYELPELLAFNVAQGEERFLQWILDSLDKSAESRSFPQAVPNTPPERQTS